MSENFYFALFGTLIGSIITALGAYLTSKYQLKAINKSFLLEANYKEQKEAEHLKTEVLSKLHLLANKLSLHQTNETRSKEELQQFNINCDQSAEIISDVLAYLSTHEPSEYEHFKKIWPELSIFRANLNIHIRSNLDVSKSSNWMESNQASSRCQSIIQETINILR
jgi:hypothetical protein